MPELPAFREAAETARSSSQPIAAFNIVDMSSLLGVCRAAAAVHRPVITQASVRTVRYYGAALMRSMVDSAKASTGCVAFLHLDHCQDETVLRDAVEGGFDGVMIDCSSRSRAENLDFTTIWARRAQSAGLFVEAEIGEIMGTEEEVSADRADEISVTECLEFAKQTGVDLIGTPVGTAHGLYQSAPAIRWEFLEELVASLSCGFVIHGGSGLEDSDLRRLARAGVTKINFSTDLKIAWAKGVGSTLNTVPEPLALLKSAEAESGAMASRKLQALRADQ